MTGELNTVWRRVCKARRTAEDAADDGLGGRAAGREDQEVVHQPHHQRRLRQRCLPALRANPHGSASASQGFVEGHDGGRCFLHRQIITGQRKHHRCGVADMCVRVLLVPSPLAASWMPAPPPRLLPLLQAS